MRHWIVAGLVLLNLMLAAGVYTQYGERPALAQIGAAKGDYAVVSGTSNNQPIVYIMEAGTGNLIAVRTDPINRKVELVATRKVADDLAKLR